MARRWWLGSLLMLGVVMGAGPAGAQSPSPSPSPSATPGPSPSAAPGPVGMPWITTSQVRTVGEVPVPRDVTAWRGGFAMLDGRSTVQLRLSADGASWGWRIPFGGPRAGARIAPFGDGLLVAGVRGWDLVAWRSTDGVAWRPMGAPPIFRGNAAKAVMASPEQLVTVGERALLRGAVECPEAICPEHGPRLWGLSRGGRWERLPMAIPGGRIREVFAGRGRFLATVDAGPEGAGTAGDPDLLVASRDGRQWRQVGTLAGDAANRGVLVGETSQGFVLVDPARSDDGGGGILMSADGTTWTERWAPSAAEWLEWSDLSVDGDAVLVVGDADSGPQAVVSADGGATWSLSGGWPSTAAGCFRMGVVRRGTAVAAGACGSAGHAWVAQVPGVPAQGVGAFLPGGIDPASVPFRYACLGLEFSAADVALAPDLAAVDPAGLAIVQRIAAHQGLRATDWRLVATDGVRTLAVGTDGTGPTGYVVHGVGGVLVAAGDRWRCAQAVAPAVGEWDAPLRLDRSRPVPGRSTRVLHLVTEACPDQRALRPRVTMLAGDVLLQVPISGSASEVGCGGDIRFDVRLPQPLGDRRIWDAARLPLERVRR